MRQLYRLAGIVVGAEVFAALIMCLSAAVWRARDVLTIAGLRDLFGSFPLLLFVLTLCGSPFMFAGVVGMYLTSRSRFSLGIRGAAWASTAITIVIGVAFELLTWQSMFDTTRSSSTAPIAFFMLPVIGVIAAAGSFIAGMIALSLTRQRRSS